MTKRNPHALLRPYFKGYSREEDEKLASELFYGTSVINEKTDRWRARHYYPPAGSSRENEAVEALCRLISSGQNLPESIQAGLLCSLDLSGSFERQLVFKRRKREKPPPSDLQIIFKVDALYRAGKKLEAAVKGATDNFGISRETVFRARRRIRGESPWLAQVLPSLNRRDDR